MNEFNNYLSLKIPYRKDPMDGSYDQHPASRILYGSGGQHPGSRISLDPEALGTEGQNPVRGFTIIELLVVILMMGLIVGIAVPGFRSFTASNMLVSETNKVVSNIRLARQRAITQGIDIVVTFYADHLDVSGTNIKLDHRVTLQKVGGGGVPGAITVSSTGTTSAFRKFELIDDKGGKMKVIVLPSGLVKSARG